MKLYWGPHTCAIGIHILLEEIGEPYEREEIDVAAGATRQPPFLVINPKGKVPTLVRDDGTVLTEFNAIATWLARTHPQANLLPRDPEIEARAVEAMAYVDSMIHGQGYGLIFAPKMFGAADADDGALASVRQQGREIVETGFGLLDRSFGQHPYAAGVSFTIADAALFYAERWAPQTDISLPPNVAAHFQRIRARPTVQKVMALWGEA